MGGTIISLFAIYSRILNRGIVPNKRTGGNLFQIWLVGLVLEFEIWRLKAITDLIYWWTFRLLFTSFDKQNLHVHCGMNQTLSAKVCASYNVFWPLTDFITMEVKNFSLGCTVWPRCCLFQDWLPVKYWWWDHPFFQF